MQTLNTKLEATKAAVMFSYFCIIHSYKLVSGKLPPRKIAPRSGSGFGLGLALELGLGGNFPQRQFS